MLTKLAIFLFALVVVEGIIRLLCYVRREKERSSSAEEDTQTVLCVEYIQAFEAERVAQLQKAEAAITEARTRYWAGQLTWLAYEQACRWHRQCYDSAGERVAEAAIMAGLDPLVAQVVKRNHYDWLI